MMMLRIRMEIPMKKDCRNSPNSGPTSICIFLVTYGRMIEIYGASRSAAFHPRAVCGHFGNPALASR